MISTAYRPHETPANTHLAGDAGGIFAEFVEKDVSCSCEYYPLQYHSSIKAALNVVEADEQLLDGPEDLTGVRSAQIGLYAHPSQTGLSLETKTRA
jgi:hypothetical protein